MKYLILITCFLVVLQSGLLAQIRIKQKDIKNHVGETVEVLGKAFLFRSVDGDFAIVKLRHDKSSAKFPVYYKFRNASTLAGLTNMGFGHFVGVIRLIGGNPVLVVDKLDNASFYPPNDERVDSALYYFKRGEL